MDLWISTASMTGQVSVNTEMTITDSAMIWKMFRGQPIHNLLNWLRTLGDKKVAIFWLSDKGEIPVNSSSELRRFSRYESKTE